MTASRVLSVCQARREAFSGGAGAAAGAGSDGSMRGEDTIAIAALRKEFTLPKKATFSRAASGTQAATSTIQ